MLRGHFALSSGLHSDRYLQCALVLMHPARAETLCRALAELWEGEAPDIVIGPALGGMTFAYEMARAFGVPGIWAERVDGRFAIRRGFKLEVGMKVMLAEDVVTTGGSVKDVTDVVRAAGARPIGVVCLVQRAQSNPFDVPLTSLMKVEVAAWPQDQCPLCAEGLPLEKPGSRSLQTKNVSESP